MLALSQKGKVFFPSPVQTMKSQHGTQFDTMTVKNRKTTYCLFTE